PHAMSLIIVTRILVSWCCSLNSVPADRSTKTLVWQSLGLGRSEATLPFYTTLITSIRPEGLPEEIIRHAALLSDTTGVIPSQKRESPKCWITLPPAARPAPGFGQHGTTHRPSD